jgi:glycosyltransferase involved in cell wall biosynthesis
MGEKLLYPLVSIPIITYNHESFIQECIESAIGQNYPNIEVICVDDASQDGTLRILQKLEKKYHNLKVVVNAQNQGITKNSNIALRQCIGEYIVPLSGDDLMMATRVRKLVEYFKENANSVICYHDAEIFDSKKSIGCVSEISVSPKNTISFLSPKTLFTGPTFGFKKSAIPEGGYDERIKIMSDWLFPIEVSMKGDIGYIPEVLGRYRRHDNNQSSSKEHYDEYFVSLGILRSKYISLAKYINKFEAHLYKAKMVRCFINREFDNAYLCSDECLKRFYQVYYFLPISMLGQIRKIVFAKIIDLALRKLFCNAKRIYNKKNTKY